MIMGVRDDLAGLGIVFVIMLVGMAVNLVPVVVFMFMDELGGLGFLLGTAAAVLAHGVLLARLGKKRKGFAPLQKVLLYDVIDKLPGALLG